MPLHTRDQSRLAFLRPVPQDFYEPCDTWKCNHCNQNCCYKNCPMCLRGRQDGIMRRCHSFCMQHGFYMLFFLLITVIVTLFFVHHVEKK